MSTYWRRPGCVSVSNQTDLLKKHIRRKKPCAGLQAAGLTEKQKQPQPISKEDSNAALEQEAKTEERKIGWAQGALLVEREVNRASGGCWEALCTCNR